MEGGGWKSEGGGGNEGINRCKSAFYRFEAVREKKLMRKKAAISQLS